MTGPFREPQKRVVARLRTLVETSTTYWSMFHGQRHAITARSATAGTSNIVEITTYGGVRDDPEAVIAESQEEWQASRLPTGGRLARRREAARLR